MKYTAEDREQCALKQWLDLTDLQHWHPLQEISIKNPAYWNKKKLMGLNPGLSDILILLPPERCISGKWAFIAIELKKPRKRLLRTSKNGKAGDMVPDSKTSKEQIDFIEKISLVPGCQGKICHGWEEARDFVTKFLK